MIRSRVLDSTFALLVLLWLGGCGSTGVRVADLSDQKPAAPSIEAKVDAFLMPLVERDLISGSVLIARDGEVLLAKGYGPANRELVVMNDPSMRYRIGSMTKQFTAMAVWILAERGLVDVDAPLSTRLPDTVPYAERITPYQLMTHTAGVPSYNRLPDYGQKSIQPMSIDEVVEWFSGEDLLFEPGTQFAYSNSGYVLLAQLIEKVSGKSYDEFLQEAIFEPLGMTSSGVDVFTTTMPGRADGYGFDGVEVYRAPYRDMPFTSGAGSLLSSCEDLLRWDRALRNNTLVSPETSERIFTAAQRGYGCGWFIGERFGRRLVSHRGDINGFRCDIQRFVDDDVTVVCLLNLESTFALEAFGGLGAIAVGADYSPVLDFGGIEVAPETLGRYQGRYEVAPGYSIVIRLGNDGVLTGQTNDEPVIPLIAQRENIFFAQGMNAVLQFDLREDGTVGRMLVQQGAARFAGMPVGE